MSSFNQPSRSVIATLWSHYLAAARHTKEIDAREERGEFGDTGDRLGDAAFNAREDIGDKLMSKRVSSLGELAIKAELLQRRLSGGLFIFEDQADQALQELCADIQSLCRRRPATVRPRFRKARKAR